MNERIIYTIGHSDHPIERFMGLLKQHDITAIADVRSAPYSRFHPQFNEETLALSLEKERIAYVFLGKELGARPEDPACYENNRVDFSRIAEGGKFKNGLERILKGCEKFRIALMCAEKEPLDCHRTILVCHNLKRFGVGIKHILSDGTLEDHRDAEARLLKLANCEQDLFNHDVNYSERLEHAYKKRASEIAYRVENKEVHHE